jgi:hypothetical protein
MEICCLFRTLQMAQSGVAPRRAVDDIFLRTPAPTEPLDAGKSNFLDAPGGLLGQVKNGILASNKLNQDDFKYLVLAHAQPCHVFYFPLSAFQLPTLLCCIPWFFLVSCRSYFQAFPEFRKKASATRASILALMFDLCKVIHIPDTEGANLEDLEEDLDRFNVRDPFVSAIHVTVHVNLLVMSSHFPGGTGINRPLLRAD